MAYKYIDLFAGIGGFHLGFKKTGMECVFASELDKNARETYIKNHCIEESIFNNDIRKIGPNDIPEHDILCAGFPCQPFSQAGHKRGFQDGSNSERGNLFFCIADILEKKRPKAFILENVRHLLKHDNGKTFQVIKTTLEDIGYKVYYKVIKASDFGKPQYRPRIYIIGFDKTKIAQDQEYLFPETIPLKQTMSDIWEGNCDRKIGFTLRVGGRGSSIDDRRNWDSYRVDGEVKQLTPIQGKLMMGFPDDFILPNSITQSMKLLGNSVCVDVIEHLSQTIKAHLIKYEYKEEQINGGNSMAKNKGEWSELYAFFKLLIDNKLHFGNEDAIKMSDYVTVIEVAHNQTNLIYEILESEIVFKDSLEHEVKRMKISSLVTNREVKMFLERIRAGEGRAFDIPEVSDLLVKSSINTSVKGKAFEKGDLKIAFKHERINHCLMPIGVKSDIGAKPTLLNASSATNFIFEVKNMTCEIDEINNINTRAKIKDRVSKIKENGASIEFYECQLSVHQNNLKKIDSLMPEMIAEVLLSYYSGHASEISDLVIDSQKQSRFKDYLKAVLLGMFYTQEWDGNYESTGSILIKNDGELTLFHVIKDSILKDYLFSHTKLDTPSSTRHRFGSVYREGNKLFIALNLQIRMM